MGGLGNQLFIIFTTIATAMQNKHPFIFAYSTILTNGCTIRYTYWESLLYRLKAWTTINSSLFRNNIKIIESGIPILIPDTNSMYELNGYFQKSKYFNDEYHEIARLIGIEERRQEMRQVLAIELNCTSTIISLHFRLGDYLKLGLQTMSVKYYVDAIRFILGKCQDSRPITIACFFEQTDVVLVEQMISQLELEFDMEFNKLIFHKISNTKLDDWQQMLLMSVCDHHIVANSTYSWWAAYIAKMSDENPVKICYYTSLEFENM